MGVLRRLPALGLACLAAGWGNEGHEATARVAADQLPREIAEAAGKILGGKSLADVATWADDVKHESAWKWSEELHFINVPRGQCTFNATRDCVDAAGVQGNCIVGALANYSGILRQGADKPGAETALKFLVHFMGDAHQPLHVAWSSDRGGNDIKVEEGFDHEKHLNLHQVWDFGIIKRELKDKSQQWQDWADSIAGGINVSSAREWSACLDDDSQELEDCLGEMANETLGLACSQAYIDDSGQLVTKLEDLSEGYYESRAKVVDLQMARGGVRLSALLRRLFRAGPEPALLLV